MEQDEKLVYEFNPYTFARISVMKSDLLKKDDYDKLMKMNPDEILKFLQEGAYSDVINQLSMKHSGIKLVESALNADLVNNYQKLKRISDAETRIMISQYLKRYDFLNLKHILRGKHTGKKFDEVMQILVPVGDLTKDRLAVLYDKDIKTILRSLVRSKDFERALRNFEQTKNLSEIENYLDYHYFADAIKFSEKLPTEGYLFREFFEYLVDAYNIKLLLKKTHFRLNKESIEQFLIWKGKRLRRSKLKSLLDIENFANLAREINIVYKGLLSNSEESNDPMLLYEIQIEKLLLQKSMRLFHQHPFTVDLVLGYMFYKEIEINNLKVIIKSKKLEFTEDYVKQLICVK